MFMVCPSLSMLNLAHRVIVINVIITIIWDYIVWQVRLGGWTDTVLWYSCITFHSGLHPCYQFFESKSFPCVLNFKVESKLTSFFSVAAFNCTVEMYATGWKRLGTLFELNWFGRHLYGFDITVITLILPATIPVMLYADLSAIFVIKIITV